MRYKSIREAIERLRNAMEPQDFHRTISLIQDYMKKLGLGTQEILKLERLAYYPSNKYSEKADRENMNIARDRVISYLGEMSNDSAENDQIVRILDNF